MFLQLFVEGAVKKRDLELRMFLPCTMPTIPQDGSLHLSFFISAVCHMLKDVFVAQSYYCCVLYAVQKNVTSHFIFPYIIIKSINNNLSTAFLPHTSIIKSFLFLLHPTY